MLGVVLLLSVVGCKSSKDTAEGRTGKGGHEMEPEQVNPRVDTRFQEAFFQAQLEKAKGNYQKAYNLFQECLRMEPKNPVIHYELGRLEMGLFENPDKAVIHAKEAVEGDRNNPWYQRLLGDTYMAMYKFDLAYKAYREVQRLNPDDPDAPYMQANALLSAGKTQEAIAIYDQLEKETGPYEELSIQKHQLYLHINQPQKAGLELEKLARAYPDEPRYLGMAAQFYQKMGMADKAKAAMEELLKAGTGNGQVHFQLSEMYAAAGDDKKSFDEMKLAFGSTDVSIDQKIAVMLRYFSLTERDPKYLPPAFELLKIVEQVHPEEAKAYSMYGDFLYRDGKSVEALKKYRKAAELDPSRQLVWEQILIVEGEVGDFDNMLTDSQAAIELFPALPQFYLFNGIAHQQKGNYNAAIDAYKMGRELVIDNDDLLMRFHSYLGELYHKTGKYDLSDEAYDKALKLDPNNVFVLNNYAYYLSLRKVKLEKAAQMAKQANELAPNQASFEDTYAWVLFQQGKYNEALQWIQKAVVHGNASGELLEHYGDILFKLGDVEGALQQWKQAKIKGGTTNTIDRKIEQGKYIE